jgi:SET domain-containing protein
MPNINPDYTFVKMKIFRSPIHRWGITAQQYVKAGKPIIEHTGQLLNRHQYAEKLKQGWSPRYTWKINDYWNLDGSTGGSGAEFINHSCNPNLEVRFLGKRVFYYSLRSIRKGEELTIDYKYDLPNKKIPVVPCNCGSKRCRGTINRKPLVAI